MKPKPLPPMERLRELLEYDPETGALTWRERSLKDFADRRYPAARCMAIWNSKFAGKPALNSPMSNGYRHGTIDNVFYLAHRVIWKIMTGEDPPGIDHINGDRGDGRFDNLRACTQRENTRNRGIARNNTSGRTGVYRNGSRWYAQIEVDGVTTTLGTFVTIEEAALARKRADALHGFHPNHGERLGHGL